MNDNYLEQSQGPVPESITTADDLAGHDDLNELASAPLVLWRGLQSYLVVDAFVESLSNQSNREAHVTVRVSNVAPVSEGRPDVYFRSVSMEVLSQRGLQSMQLGPLEPGRAVEKQFTFEAKELATVEFRVSGDVDSDRLFRLRQKGGLPREVVRPLLEEFAGRFETIGIKEPLNKALASIAKVQPAMTLADASLVRKELSQVQPLIEEKVAGLQDLFGEFHLNQQSALGAQCHEVWMFLRELGTRIQAVDNAIGETDPESINQAVHELEQLKLSVLQVEETIRLMTSA